MVDPSPTTGIRVSKNQTDSYSLEHEPAELKDQALFKVSDAVEPQHDLNNGSMEAV